MPDHSSEFQDTLNARKTARREHWDALATDRDQWRRKGRAYHDEIIRLLRFLIPEGLRILEIGSTTGDVLSALKPATGVGIDLSPKMVEQAREKYSSLTFHVGDAECLPDALKGQVFDVIIMSDLVGHLDDVWRALREARMIAGEHTRLVMTWYNFLWEPALKLGEKIGLKMPVQKENWLSLHDLSGFLHLNHFEVVQSGSRVLLPARIPLLAPLVNKFLAPLPVVRWFNLVEYLVARPTPVPQQEPLSTSVVIPCRNEVGNVQPALDRMPSMGPKMEVVFCDGHSSDGTVEEIERLRDSGNYPFEIRLLHQEGKGKADAVHKAYDESRNDVLFILDADLTVPPEDLPKFYAAVAEGRGEFINGTRLVYPMERQAMRSLNRIGNKFFSLVISSVLGQRVKDTLCGTKVFRRREWAGIQEDRPLWGNRDPWGDFELIFGAAKRNLRIRDLPVRYLARTHGETKMNAMSEVWTMLMLVWRAFCQLRMRR